MYIIKVWNQRSLSFVYVKKLLFNRIIHITNEKKASKCTKKAADKILLKFYLTNHQIIKCKSKNLQK